MTRDSLHAEIARQRQAEFRRVAERHALGDQARARTRAAQLLGGSRRSRVSLRAFARLSRGLLPR
jgi:hypothetical protein